MFIKENGQKELWLMADLQWQPINNGHFI